MLEPRAIASAEMEAFSAFVALLPVWLRMCSRPISKIGKGGATSRFCCPKVAACAGQRSAIAPNNKEKRNCIVQRCSCNLRIG
jgi:hypothetical protein